MKNIVKKNDFEKMLKKAQKLLDEKDYFNALVLFEQAKFSLNSNS